MRLDNIWRSRFGLIRSVIPGATVQYPADVLASVLRAQPDRTMEMLHHVGDWGIDRHPLPGSTERQRCISRVAASGFPG
jgi:hypothetical protein